MSVLDDLLPAEQPAQASPAAAPPPAPAPAPASAPEPAKTGNVLDDLLADQSGSKPTAQAPSESTFDTGDVLKSAGTGLGKGLIAGVGLPGDVRHLAGLATDYIGSMIGSSGLKDTVRSGVAASPLAPILQAPTSEDIQKKVEGVTGEFHKPTSTVGKYAQTVGEFLGNPLSYAGPGGLGAKIAMAAGAGMGSEALGQAGAATEVPGGETTGRILGSVLGAVVARKPFNISNKTVVNTTDELYEAADTGYKVAGSLPVRINTRATDRILDDVKRELKTAQMRDYLAPHTYKAIEELATPAAGSHSTITDIDSVRQLLGRISKSNIGPMANGNERLAARTAIRVIDDGIENLGRADVKSGAHLLPTLKKEILDARANYSAASRSEILEEAVNKALNRVASTGKGGNIDNVLRQEFKSIIQSPNKRWGYSPEERAMMQEIVRGTFWRNKARYVGMLAPSGIVSLAGSLGIGALLGGAKGMETFPLIGLAAKKIGDYGTERAVAKAQDMVRLRSAMGAANNPNLGKYRPQPLSPYVYQGATTGSS